MPEEDDFFAMRAGTVATRERVASRTSDESGVDGLPTHFLREAVRCGVVELPPEEQEAVSEPGSALMDEAVPGAARRGAESIMGEEPQITLTAEDGPELAGAAHTPCRAGHVREREGLVVQVFDPVPPAVEDVLLGALKGLFHEAAAFAVAEGMGSEDLLRAEGVDAGGFEQLLQGAELVAQKCGGWSCGHAQSPVWLRWEWQVKAAGEFREEALAHLAVTAGRAGILHGADVHAHGLKDGLWQCILPEAQQGEEFFHSYTELMRSDGFVRGKPGDISLCGIEQARE